MLFKLTLFILFELVYALEHKHRLYKRDCAEGSITGDYNVGYQGAKSNYHLSEVMSAARGFQDWLNANSQQTSHSYTGQANIGQVIGFMWVGPMIVNNGLVDNMVGNLYNYVNSNGIGNIMYVQYCGSGDPAKTAGIIFDVNGNTDNTYRAVKNWSEGKCYDNNDYTDTWSGNTICVYNYNDKKSGNPEASCGECDYIKVTSGMDIESATGVTGDAIQMYNSNLDFSSLSVGTPICYSIGNLPDLRVSKNDNGTCYAYYVQDGDTCAGIAANYYPLSTDDIENYNKQTYGWMGCTDLQKDSVICVSDGDPPKPVPNPLAECGPLAPGDKYNSECPLNACCSEFGFCGLTSEFCDTKDSSTGAPGTTGCYSNCGYGELPLNYNSNFESVGYWMDKAEDDPLFVDTSEIDDIDIIIYSFMNINDDFTIDVPDDFENNNFFNNYLTKIVSFGGWDFSTDPWSYHIFRDLVSNQDNINTFVNSLKDLVNNYDIDGIDLDWEYPGAPDIPGIPADDPNNGQNYLTLLKAVKINLLDKLVSVTLPSSYWYLKPYPVTEIQEIADFMTVMTYDLYGQWDYGKPDTGLICHTDKSKISDTIKMLNKAGVDFSKLHGGLANYARTYQVSDTSCLMYPCGYTGPGSGAQPGNMTKTPGIMSEDELDAIASEDIDDYWFDDNSQCTYQLYYTNNWAAWTDAVRRPELSLWFQDMGFKGTSLWAVNYGNTEYNNDYEDYEDDENDEDEDTYIDYYNCSNVIVDSLEFDVYDVKYGCVFEAINNYLINQGKVYADIINTILNDYDNYMDYFQAYLKYYDDNVNAAYVNWTVLGGINFFTYLPEDEITITNIGKREFINSTYTNNTELNSTSNITVYLRPQNSILSFPNNTNITIDNYKLKNILNIDNTLNFNNTLQKRADQPDYPSIGKALIGDFKIVDCVIENKDKQLAMNDFYTFSGFNITTDALIQEAKTISHSILSVSGGTDYYFTKSTILNPNIIYPNPMNGVTQENITNILNLIDIAEQNVGLEDPDDVYQILEPVALFISMSNVSNTTYVIGKQIYNQEQKEKKMLILDLILGIFGGITIFFGDIGTILSTIADVSTIVGNVEIAGVGDVGEFAVSVLGLFLPLFSDIKNINKASDLAENVRDFKNLDKLTSLEIINNMRTKLGKDICQ